MLELAHVDTFYGNIQALRDVSLHIDDGEMVTLIGANGAGKSTTLMTICGVNRARRGKIFWNGEAIENHAPNTIVSLGISQVPEGRLIFPDMTVSENLDLGAFLRNDQAVIRQDKEYVFELSHPGREAQAARRHAFRRRTANAGHKPRANGAPKTFTA